ncbi:MAG: hypothetical protein PVH19_03730 [Planctomycetia bacterium]|jgi:hypothetical protein
MICLSIKNTTEVYCDASECEITRHWIDHPALADVSCSLRMLLQSVGTDVEDDFWRLTIRSLRQITFALCSVPMPFVAIADKLKLDWEKFTRQVRLCRQLYPDAHEPLDSLRRSLEPILAETTSPFLPVLESIAKLDAGMSLTMCNLQWNRSVVELFANNAALCNVQLVSATQLRGARRCNTLAVIGRCAWFPEHVFAAPRATSVHIISYRWIKDTWKPGPVLLHSIGENNSHNGNHRIGSLPRISNSKEPEGIELGNIQTEDILPPLPPFTHGSFQSTGNGTTDGEETLPARLCLLSGGRAVYVSAEDGVSSLVIDTSELGDSMVRHIPTEKIEPGMYLLLRTAGESDFIATLADRILGAQAKMRRSQQVEWKDKLLERARGQFGVLPRRKLSRQIAKYLQTFDSIQVRAVNIHYWMGSKCIHPRKRKHFSAILRFAGIAEKEEELWKAMGDIDRAHRRAGRHITKMLLQKIATSSLDTLERDGEMDFDLGDQHGGTLSAYQVTEILGEELEVPAILIGRLREEED